MNRKPIIFLDMDGVSIDLHSASIEVNGCNPVKIFSVFETGFKEEELYEVIGVKSEKFWEVIHKKGEEFWVNLDEYPWFWDLYNKLTDITEVFFLSAPTHSPSCLSGKLKWLHNRFGPDFDKYIITWNKYLLADTHTLLIDDSQINVRNFIDYGGNAILFPQMWNENGNVEDKIDFVVTEVVKWYDKTK